MVTIIREQFQYAFTPLAILVVCALLLPKVSASEEIKATLLLEHDIFSLSELPNVGDTDEAFNILDYLPGERPLVHAVDLDGDGSDEVFLTSSYDRLCGTGGCPYLLLEGRSRKIIGEFFGTLVLAGPYVNGFPVIQSISTRGAEGWDLGVYVYEGTSYVQVSHASLDALGRQEWLDGLQAAKN